MVTSIIESNERIRSERKNVSSAMVWKSIKKKQKNKKTNEMKDEKRMRKAFASNIQWSKINQFCLVCSGLKAI